MPGIEHPPHFLLITCQFSSQLHVTHAGLTHREIERRFRRHRSRQRNLPLPPRRPGSLRDFPPVSNPSGNRLLQTIRSLPERVPLSVSLRDSFRNIPECDHETPRFIPTLEFCWIHERPHSHLLHSASSSLRPSCLSIL